MHHKGGNLFSKLHPIALLIIREDMSAGLRFNISLYNVCKELLLCCFLLSIVCFKSMELLTFDLNAKTEVVRRF